MAYSSSGEPGKQEHISPRPSLLAWASMGRHPFAVPLPALSGGADAAAVVLGAGFPAAPFAVVSLMAMEPLAAAVAWPATPAQNIRQLSSDMGALSTDTRCYNFFQNQA